MKGRVKVADGSVTVETTYQGVGLEVTTKGLLVSTWYDGGWSEQEPTIVPWDVIDRLRADLR